MSAKLLVSHVLVGRGYWQAGPQAGSRVRSPHQSGQQRGV